MTKGHDAIQFSRACSIYISVDFEDIKIRPLFCFDFNNWLVKLKTEFQQSVDSRVVM